MKKVMLLIVLLLTFLALLFFLQEKKEPLTQKPTITVSTFALYDIVKAVGGDHVDVQMLIPFGVEVHSFEPTPKTIIALQKSQRFFYSGADLEPWVKKLTHTANMRDMSQYVQLRRVDEHDEKEEDHHHGAFDPHYWLDVRNMILLTEQITKELTHIDPKHSTFYKRRSKEYISKLHGLDQAYKNGLESCHVRMVILNHNILGYLGARYHFSVETLTGFSPDALADAQTMVKLSRIIKEKGVHVLFYEAFVSDRLMQSLADENGIKLDYLEPLANITAQQAAENMDYIRGMQSNLEKLSEAMECR